VAFRLTEIQTASFPSADALEVTLADYGTGVADLVSALRSFTGGIPASSPGGYQQYLARHLEQFLSAHLTAKPGVRSASPKYSPNLGERADVAVGVEGKPSLYVEIEFRPNVEKDLAKFQIGHHTGRLAVGILILALSRKRLNADYSTMPEFAKFVRIVPEFRPQHPLLLIGIDGEHDN
jgi:hypothetical protein